MVTRPLDLSQERRKGRERKGRKEGSKGLRWGCWMQGGEKAEAVTSMRLVKNGERKQGKQEPGKEEVKNDEKNEPELPCALYVPLQ